MDDEPHRVPKAGRRAGRKVDNWGMDEPGGNPSAFVDPDLGPAPEGPAPSWGGDDGGGMSDLPPPPPTRGFGDLAVGDAPSSTPRPAPRTRTPNNDLSLDDDPMPRSAGPPPPSGTAPDFNFLGEDSGKKFAGVSRRKAEQLAHGDEEVVKKNQKYDELTAGADGIMDIPELEEEGKEDLSQVVAEAPKIRAQKVQGMDQLEEDMHFKLPATDDRDIDLSLLTGVLCSSEQVQESDEVWDPEIILTEVASALYSEKEKAEDGDKDDSSKEELKGI